MKKIMLVGFLVMLCGVAKASCFGSDSFQTCTDNSGNNYSVQRFGNQTYMNGSNSSTGSTWSQNSTTIGNTTFHNGTSADGGSWNGTSTRIGSTSFYNGTDSDGNSYIRTCNQFGCY